MRLTLPDFGLVVLIGARGAGKSRFAARHFAPDAIVTDGPDAAGRLDASLTDRRLAVADGVHLAADERRDLLRLARARHAPTVAVLLVPEEEVTVGRDLRRRDAAPAGARTVRDQTRSARRLEGGRLAKEGFDAVHVLASAEAIDAADVVRAPLPCDRRGLAGPFDVVGDVHGCLDELRRLLDRLGYAVAADGRLRHPGGRTAVFAGDLVDRGPDTPGVLRLVMDADDGALCVPGNHDDKLARALAGRDVRVTADVRRSLDGVAAAGDGFALRVRAFLDGLPSHLWLDGGRLVVAHAGLLEAMHGRSSRAEREFALFGDTMPGKDAAGRALGRWARGYHGDALVVHGHTPVTAPRRINNALCIDTGCVAGGLLTAFRYPEGDTLAVPARRSYTGGGRTGGPAPADATPS